MPTIVDVRQVERDADCDEAIDYQAREDDYYPRPLKGDRREQERALRWFAHEMRAFYGDAGE